MIAYFALLAVAIASMVAPCLWSISYRSLCGAVVLKLISDDSDSNNYRSGLMGLIWVVALLGVIIYWLQFPVLDQVVENSMTVRQGLETHANAVLARQDVGGLLRKWTGKSISTTETPEKAVAVGGLLYSSIVVMLVRAITWLLALSALPLMIYSLLAWREELQVPIERVAKWIHAKTRTVRAEAVASMRAPSPGTAPVSSAIPIPSTGSMSQRSMLAVEMLGDFFVELAAAIVGRKISL